MGSPIPNELRHNAFTGIIFLIFLRWTKWIQLLIVVVVVVVSPLNAQMLLYVTPLLTLKKFMFCAHSAFILFGWFSDQITLSSLFSISRLVFRNVRKITKNDT
jgi:hypothetical protein